MRESKEETKERFLLLNFFATNKQKSWPVAEKILVKESLFFFIPDA